ncbi:hypothetical protein [Sphingomonas sp. LR55]|uniref:hypothetical protein n=1 Tax=Sphingomonas sp. LR55 TaxID=3050231 RepID=UPI002FE1E52C
MKTTYTALLVGTALSFATPGQAQTASPTSVAASETYNRMIVFGDSLADGGYYLALDPSLPRDAGSFTTNPDPVSPEVLAARLGLPLDPVYGKGGTNYAVGGARDGGQWIFHPGHDPDQQLPRRWRHVRSARSRLHPGRRERLFRVPGGGQHQHRDPDDGSYPACRAGQPAPDGGRHADRHARGPDRRRRGTPAVQPDLCRGFGGGERQRAVFRYRPAVRRTRRESSDLWLHQHHRRRLYRAVVARLHARDARLAQRQRDLYLGR